METLRSGRVRGSWVISLGFDPRLVSITCWSIGGIGIHRLRMKISNPNGATAGKFKYLTIAGSNPASESVDTPTRSSSVRNLESQQRDCDVEGHTVS